MENTQMYKLGKLPFSISGSDRILPYIQAELKSLRTNDKVTSKLNFYFSDKLPGLREYVSVPPVLLNETAYQAQYGNLKYQAFSEKEGVVVYVKSESTRLVKELLPSWLFRIINWNYLSLPESIAKNFMYDIFDYLTQIAQLPFGQSYLHASSVTRGKQAIALIGWGGIGKTSAMLKLILEDGWRFLSDDLGLIDRDGMLWRTPKHMQIYAYNAHNQPLIRQALLAEKSPLDLASWYLHYFIRGSHKVRRRVSAETLFGASRVAHCAHLTHAFFLERATVDDFIVRPINVDDLVHRAVHTLLKELQPYVDLTAALNSGANHPTLLPIDVFCNQTSDVLTKAFAHTQPKLLRVPLKASPDDLLNCLRNLLL